MQAPPSTTKHHQAPSNTKHHQAPVTIKHQAPPSNKHQAAVTTMHQARPSTPMPQARPSTKHQSPPCTKHHHASSTTMHHAPPCTKHRSHHHSPLTSYLSPVPNYQPMAQAQQATSHRSLLLLMHGRLLAVRLQMLSDRFAVLGIEQTLEQCIVCIQEGCPMVTSFCPALFLSHSYPTDKILTVVIRSPNHLGF